MTCTEEHVACRALSGYKKERRQGLKHHWPSGDYLRCCCLPSWFCLFVSPTCAQLQHDGRWSRVKIRFHVICALHIVIKYTELGFIDGKKMIWLSCACCLNCSNSVLGPPLPARHSCGSPRLSSCLQTTAITTAPEQLTFLSPSPSPLQQF